MDYFRRPLLAGRNLPRTPYASIRGSIRRTNPDVNSTAPYFPGITNGSTLHLKIDGVAKTVTFTGNSLQTILTEINTALGTSGKAVDSGGCVNIVSLSSGGTSSVEITGGTAAVALGFDLKGGAPLIAVGGDLPSSPEAGMGNPFGTVFPSRTENLSTDSFRSALGRIAANADTLYADLARKQTRLAKAAEAGVANQTILSGSTRYGVVSLPQGTTVFSGYGILSGSSKKEDLAPYFLIVDKKTRQPAASRVVGVVKGTLPAPSYTDGVLNAFGNATTSDGVGNILGVLLPRTGVQNAPILDIRNGRVIRAAGIFAKVRVGDWVKIDGPDNVINKDPTDNRGLRWVVEEKIGSDNDAIAVRPMSKAELAYAGTVLPAGQAVVDLNDQKSGGQSFGTVTVYSGPFLDDVQLIVSPPISDTVEVWAAVPSSYRDEKGHEVGAAVAPLARMLMEDSSAVPDALVTAPTLTLSGTLDSAGRTAEFGEMYVRWRGRVVRVGAQNVVIGGSRGSNVYLYLDVASLRVELTTNAATAAANLLLAYVAAGSQATATLAPRIVDAKAHDITVGVNGQFSSLQAAVQWIAAQGTTEKYNVYVVSDQTLPAGGLKIPAPGIIHIVGTGVGIVLTHGDGSPMFDLQGNALALSNVSLTQDAAFANGTPVLRNVRRAVAGSTSVWESGNARITEKSTGIEIDSAVTNAVIDIGAAARTIYLGRADDIAITNVRSRFKVDRTSELAGGLTVGKTDGTGDAVFNGNVKVGETGRARKLTVIGDLEATGNLILGATGANTVTSYAQFLAQGGLVVGTPGAKKDSTFNGNITVTDIGTFGSITSNGDVTVRGDVDLTTAGAGKGALKAKTIQVAGATGFNVEADGKVVVGGAGKASMQTDGRVGNAAGYISPAGQLVGATAQVGGASGFNVDASGNVIVGPTNRIYLGVDGVAKASRFTTRSATNVDGASIDSEGRAAFKLNMELDVTNSVPTDGFVLKKGGTITAGLYRDGAIAGTALAIGGYKAVEIPQANDARGGYNFLALASRQGRRLYTDEEFQLGVNNVQIYNNGTAGAVTHTRMDDASAPNATRKILRVTGNATAGATPGCGGITFQQQSKRNGIFVMTLKAKVPAGVALADAANAYGDGGKTYWLTNQIGTGKYEDYVVVWMCGNGGTFGTLGFVFMAPSGGITTATMDIASVTMFDATDFGLEAAVYTNIDASGYITAGGKITARGGFDCAGVNITNCPAVRNPGYIDYHIQAAGYTHRFFIRDGAGADQYIGAFMPDGLAMNNKKVAGLARATVAGDAVDWGLFNEHMFWPSNIGGTYPNLRKIGEWQNSTDVEASAGTRIYGTTGTSIYSKTTGGHTLNSVPLVWESPKYFYPARGPEMPWGGRDYRIQAESIHYWDHFASGEPYRTFYLYLQVKEWVRNESRVGYVGDLIADWYTIAQGQSWAIIDYDGSGQPIYGWTNGITYRNNGNWGWLEDVGAAAPALSGEWRGYYDRVVKFRLVWQCNSDDTGNTLYHWKYARIYAHPWLPY